MLTPPLPSYLRKANVLLKNKYSSLKLMTIGLLAIGLSGCGALAAPCRLASTVIKIVPVVGHAAALPTDACAAVIDP